MKKRKQDKITDEDKAIAELYVTCYKSLHDSTLSLIRLYENNFKSLNQILSLELDNEPFKFFKKSHIEWENKIKELKNKIELNEQNLFEEYKELEKLLELTNFSDEKIKTNYIKLFP